MILVTGGAGFIGSHTVMQMRDAGYDVAVLDDLSSGVREAVPDGVPLIEGDIADTGLVAETIRKYNVDTVLHFAALINVDESVAEPFEYYDNNFIGSFNLIRTCVANGVKNFIFSSTCAVLGSPQNNPVNEDFPLRPESPYAKSKIMTEWLLQDVAKVSPLRYVILRYFNVAGARRDGTNGLRNDAHHLIAACCRTALGKQPKMKIFGTDYPTPDGTCIRDFIHVDDLADLHVAALRYLEKGGDSDIFHCGYGRGFSVKEVIEEFQKANGVNFPVEYDTRRAGDIVAIFNDPAKITAAFGWQPKYDDLALICRDSFAWEKKLANSEN